MKKFLQIIYKIIIAAIIVGGIVLLISLLSFINFIFKPPTPTPTATNTPELLIVPATQTPTPTTIPTTKPTQQIRNAQIPIYDGNGYLIGYMGDTPTPTPRHCTIKGNVSWRNNDEKIYHCPNWRDYNRTSIDYEDGDIWFCSEQEAIAAGFRKPDNVSAPCIP